MTNFYAVARRHQFCARCGQLIFEYFCSPDGHFGLVDSLEDFDRGKITEAGEVRCPTCGSRYRLLDRLNPAGLPVERK